MRMRAIAGFGLGLLLASALPALAWGPPNKAQRALAEAAMEQVKEHVVYDPAYRQIDYPGGDVPRNRGVCADVVIRAYRELGVDLQVLVHEDMHDNFSKYPHLWGLRRPTRTSITGASPT